MIERINKNEERLDKAKETIKKINEAISSYKENKKDIKLLEKYYTSKNWIKDKELYETKKIKKIKAGVLSEDEVWNLLEEYNCLLKEIKKILNKENI